MEIAIKILGIAFLIFGLALPVWTGIQILYKRAFNFRKSRVIPVFVVFVMAVLSLFIFWDSQKIQSDFNSYIIWCSLYYFAGVVFSWIIHLKSKHWRSLLQLSALAVLGTPFILLDFSDLNTLQTISFWGGCSGFYLLGYSVNATWRKEQTLSGAVLFGSFLFIVPMLIVEGIGNKEYAKTFKEITELLLLVSLNLAAVIQWVRSRRVLRKSLLILTSLLYAILLVGVGYFLINRLPEFKWEGTLVQPKLLIILFSLGGFTGMLTYLIGLKAKLLKKIVPFTFLQDRTFVINIERYSYLIVWSLLIWIAYFLTGLPGVIIIAVSGLGSLLLNYPINFTNTVLYGWAIALFLVFVSFAGGALGGTSIDLAHPKILLWATLGGVGVGVHLFFYDIQKYIFGKRNFDLALIITLVATLFIAPMSLYMFTIYELLGGFSAALSMLMVILFASWLRNDRTNFVNPLWISFGFVALFLPLVERDNPMNLSKNQDEISKSINQNQEDNEAENAQPFELEKAQGEWSIVDTSSTLAFTLVSKKGDTHGVFHKFSGEINIKDTSVQVNIDVEAKSVDTDNSTRDESLRNEEGFFEVDQFPLMKYRSKLSKKTDTAYLSIGQYSLLAKTRKIEIPFSIVGIAQKNDQTFMILEGHTSILPGKYKMTAAEQLGEKVNIKFRLRCLKQ